MWLLPPTASPRGLRLQPLCWVTRCTLTSQLALGCPAPFAPLLGGLAGEGRDSVGQGGPTHLSPSGREGYPPGLAPDKPWVCWPPGEAALGGRLLLPTPPGGNRPVLEGATKPFSLRLSNQQRPALTPFHQI